MFWNKKEERKDIPDLPPIKSPFSKELTMSSETSLEDDEKEDDEKVEKHSLPSFPDSPINKGFSQAAIKEAVSQDELPEQNKKVSTKIEKSFKTIQIEEPEESPSLNENPYLASIKSSYPAPKPYSSQPINNPKIQNSAPKAPNITPPPVVAPDFISKEELPKSQGKDSDIFVKIDKFYSGKKTLESIKDQIDQIDNLLKKIRDTKIKEEHELAGWEKEIALVKSRIQNVNDNIFEKTS